MEPSTCEKNGEAKLNMEPSTCEKNGEANKRNNICECSSRPKFSSLVSFPRNWVKQTVKPILSLKSVRPIKGSSTMILVFLLKVAALEILRRRTKTKYPQIWWGLQGLPLLQTPSLSWLQKWTPLRFLIKGTKVFSKPIFFLSLATTITNAFEEQKERTNVEELSRILSLSDSSNAVSSQHESSEINEESNNLLQLHQELEKADIHLPTRFNDEELERFMVATNRNVKGSIERIKKTIKWRDTYYFLSSSELKQWLHLVFWHGHDVKLRPMLIIRLGQAFATLQAHQRPQFVQAIVSQVEYGTINLLYHNDPRITVIMDCIGASVNGFPMHLMKSCCLLFKENYPMCLAALVAVNVPESLGELANAILQILEPATRHNICLAGEDYSQILAAYVGGLNHISQCLVGQCRCTICIEARMPNKEQSGTMNSGASAPWDDEDLERVEGVHSVDQLTSYQSCTAMVRLIILGFLMLWVLVALVVGLNDLDYTVLAS